ncbi:MAG: ATP-binding protein [Deltaproteobacteria bacterium]|nr:MAG: ATP-binding protein [Deltaproteobacteria bacterium]
MINRPFWIERLYQGWKKRPLVWLAGVRRAGKTTLAKMLPDTVYMNCDLPSVEERLEDPESFFRSQSPGRVIVLDEVHGLPDPSRVLKIAVDEFPGLRLLATGSSTLAANRKFRDALTGRKVTVYLPPVLWSECRDFGVMDLDDRLLRGGLPEALLAKGKDDEFFSEWLSSFYARDIQELFGIRHRTGFLSLLRLLLRQSGGQVDFSALSRECDMSRPTVKAHLEALQVACAVFLLPPFHGGSRREILKRPKAYAFDTGFVTFARGWKEIHTEDRGPLWEHLVLDALRASVLEERLGYWRDKSGREVDFTISRGEEVDAVECKLQPSHFNTASLEAFRKLYPKGRNFLVCPGVEQPYERRFGKMTVLVCSTKHLPEQFR